MEEELNNKQEEGKKKEIFIYHEKQRLQLCLLHALNNLLQGKDFFSRSDLDAIANKLVHADPQKENWTPLSLILKPHHNTLTGNYDINVLIAALEGKGKKVVWHDRRNGASSIDLSLSEEELIGIVLNIPVSKYGGLWRSRHWVALKRIDGLWYNLDSDLVGPKPFKREEEVKEFLDDIISRGVMQLMEFMKKLRRGYYLNNLIALVCIFVSVSCLLVLLLSILGLPEVSLGRGKIESPHSLKFRKRSNEEGRLGELGKMMVAMLPDDLAFTVFVPSERAFERDLKLWANDSLGQQKENETFAILSRVLGFSAVPQHLPSVAVPLGGEISFDSVSGLRLDATRVSDGNLAVNTVRSEHVDLSKGEILIHIMGGVIMDAEFAQSFLPDYDDED